ncbi:hypothetical protein ABH935_007055 [Catenulispora sp. GAS73]|uniref:hypothetical protein n=1 Tax=Catenulispora sp. GAS73 TaxID=3156269 RepID=UPI00351477CB
MTGKTTFNARRTRYCSRARHRRPRTFRRMPIARLLAAFRARQSAAMNIQMRPAKQIARAARHEQTRQLGGRWHV